MKSPCVLPATAMIGLFAAISIADAGDLPSHPPMHNLKPSTTGVPGAEVRVMTVDPEGNLWIAARWPFWWHCAVAMLPVSEHDVSPQPGGGFDTGRWTVWSNVDHPIPSVFIDDIEFTSDGVMWIGSEGGLTRFDRHALTPKQMWQTWNTSNSPLIVDGVVGIDSDASGNLWVVNRVVNSLLGGVFQFNPSTGVWTHHPMQGSNWDFAPTSICVGANGHVYVTHAFATGFSTYDGSTWTYQSGGTNFSGVLRDQQGNLWFGGGIGGLGGLWKWNGSTFQSWSLDPTGLSLGLDGTVFVSTWDGPVYKMIGGVTPQFFVNAQGLPRAVIERPSGDFFINNYGSTMALGRVRQYSSSGQLLRRMNTYNAGLPDYFIDTITRDRSGNLWFGSSEAGLSRMLGSDATAPTRWRNFGDHNDGAEPYPWAGSEPLGAMLDDGDGTIWMGGNGIGKWNEKTGSFDGFWNWSNSSLGGTLITKFIRDGNGDLWASTDMWGIYRFNPTTNDWEPRLFGPGGSTSNYIAGMARDTDGNLWIATPASLHMFNGTNWFAVSQAHGSPINFPTALAADPRGGIWIGGVNGLFKYHNGTWTAYHTGNSLLPINHISHLDVREDGLLGIMMSDYTPTPPQTAIALFDGEEEWQVYSASTHPFPHWQFGQIGFDADGDLWVSTMSEGVVEIDLPGRRAGDVNGDGVVNVIDLLAVISSWGACEPAPVSCAADVDGDEDVDVADLLIVISNWGD